MSSGSYRQVRVECPFYRSDDGKGKIICEGLTDDSSLILSFRKRISYERHMDNFCCRRYKYCELYGAINRKYEEEE